MLRIAKVCFPILFVLAIVFGAFGPAENAASAAAIPWGATENSLATSFDGARDIYAADMDGDGDLDVLGAAYLDNDIAWWENTNGDGSAWTKYTIYGDFNGASSVQAADIDGDGDLDVVAAGLIADEISWWENTGDNGTLWDRHVVKYGFNGAKSVFAADMDGDGRMDIVGTSAYADAVYWWKNNTGAGTTWTEYVVEDYINRPCSISVADVDGDGDPDVVGAADLASDVAWWENTNGDGSAWTKHTLDGAYDHASSVYPVDLDRDGDVDILATASGADEITWWENTSGAGTAWTEHTVASGFDGAISVYAADLDGDGDLDVLGAAYDAYDLTWWKNETIHRSAYFPDPDGKHMVDANFSSVQDVQAADMDGDGDLDMVGVSPDEDRIAWWENIDGVGTTWSRHHVAVGILNGVSVYVTDLDGDGDLDVLGADYELGEIRWWENTNGVGTAWLAQTVTVDYDEVTSICVADVDGDGNLDVLATSEDENSVAWWENKDGAGTLWSKHVVGEAFHGAKSVYAADMNSDGNMDVVGAAYGGDVAWWENTDGTGTHWLRHLVDGDAFGTTSVYAADLNGDGDQDVLSLSQFEFSVIWWENTNGAGTAWTKHIVDDDFHMASDVYAADLDGDGDQDVLATSDSSVIWWENTNGAGTTWTEHVVDDHFNQPSSISVADVDGDGDADVVGAADLAGEIVWWENRGGQFRLNTGATAPGRMAPGAADDVLKITMTHLGRSGDSSEEFASLKLLFEGCYGNGCTPNSPLTSDQAHELFDALHIYRDEGDGAFDSASDYLVDANVTSFTLVDGVQTIAFHDGGGNLRVDYGAPETYFVVLDRVDSVPAAATISRFRVTHVSEAGSSAEDRSYDIPLLIEYAPNMATDSISIALPPQGADDGGAGFETTEDTAFVTANVLSNDSYTDGDGLSVTDFDASATLGLVSNNGDGTFHYDPNGQFGDLLHGQSASDSFSYTVSDGVSTATATVTITIWGANADPLAVNDSGAGFITDKNTAFTTASVLRNDSDPEGDLLSVESVDTSGTLGLVSHNGDGTFQYDPNGQFDNLALDERATDSFTYSLSDGYGGSATATVTITVTGGQDGFYIHLPLVLR